VTLAVAAGPRGAESRDTARCPATRQKSRDTSSQGGTGGRGFFRESFSLSICRFVVVSSCRHVVPFVVVSSCRRVAA
jgi:hypothetical protein